jgi:chemotaxis protein MotB
VARKKKHPEHVNHERWLVSYADFITLLFAFFVVMFAVSQVDTNKVGRFSESVRAASKWQLFEDAATAPVSGVTNKIAEDNEKMVSNEQRQNARDLAILIKEILQDSLASGRVGVIDGPDGVIIRLNDTAYFPSGQASLRADHLKDLEALAKVMLRLPNHVRIEGHTDPRPIQTAIYPSNWELSAARAASMLRFLSSAGVPEEKLAIVGYADRRPIVSNDTEAGRQKNRRVDVVLLREKGVSEGAPPKAIETPAPQTPPATSANGVPMPKPAGAR